MSEVNYIGVNEFQPCYWSAASAGNTVEVQNFSSIPQSLRFNKIPGWCMHQSFRSIWEFLPER